MKKEIFAKVLSVGVAFSDSEIADRWVAAASDTVKTVEAKSPLHECGLKMQRNH